MLTQSNEYGYASMGGGYAQQQQQQQQQQQTHSGERPKLFALDSAVLQQHNGYVLPGYPHQIMHQSTPQHGLTPQQHHQQHQQYDHEPLMMGIHGANQYYQPIGGQMLQISTDYHQQHHAAATPASSTNSGGNAGSKRSREELNMKEKKRMFKLNDRITQLKVVLEEAGVQTKKNKQSVLDNTYHYIGMLRSNLLIAKQKAERAEKQAETFRSQVQRMGNSGGSGDAMFKRCFQQSSTPRIIVDPSLNLVAVNPAFLAHSGESEESLANVANVRASLCVDDAKLQSIVNTANSNMRPSSMVVQARAANGTATVTLMASSVADEVTGATTIEFSLVPFEISSSAMAPSSMMPITSHSDIITPQSSGFATKPEPSESSPSGVSDLGIPSANPKASSS